jgi:hypothetical protein
MDIETHEFAGGKQVKCPQCGWWNTISGSDLAELSRNKNYNESANAVPSQIKYFDFLNAGIVYCKGCNFTFDINQTNYQQRSGNMYTIKEPYFDSPEEGNHES